MAKARGLSAADALLAHDVSARSLHHPVPPPLPPSSPSHALHTRPDSAPHSVMLSDGMPHSSRRSRRAVQSRLLSSRMPAVYSNRCTDLSCDDRPPPRVTRSRVRPPLHETDASLFLSRISSSPASPPPPRPSQHPCPQAGHAANPLRHQHSPPCMEAVSTMMPRGERASDRGRRHEPS